MADISIVTVCLNSELSIEQCLNSIARQVGVDIDHVIVDGGSMDSTTEIIKSVSPKSRLFILPGSGIYEALNFGIKKARTNIIGILHSNDVFMSDNILSLVQLEFNNCFGLDVFCGSAVVNADFQEMKVDRYINSNLFVRKQLMRIGFMPAHTGLFHTKSVFEKIGGYDTSYHSASDFKFCFEIFFNNRFEFSLKTSPNVVTMMSSGGTSSSGIRSYWRTAREITMILNENQLRISVFQHCLRLAIKKLHSWVYILGFRRISVDSSNDF